MQDYLENKMSREKLRIELEHPETEFYFAEADDQIAGYLKVNWGSAQTGDNGDRALQLERIYLLKAFQGSGIADLLFNKALDIARREHCDEIWLGVWGINKRAIRFYEKRGFKHAGVHLFEWAGEMSEDVLMKLSL